MVPSPIKWEREYNDLVKQEEHMQFIIRVFFALSLILGIVSAEAIAEAPIIDNSNKYSVIDNDEADAETVDAIQPGYHDNMEQSSESSRPSSSQANNELLLAKINNLQQEIQKLRGQLEVQAHDLRLLTQQQEAYYKDLDQRIAQLKTGNPQSGEQEKLNKPTTKQKEPIDSTKTVVTDNDEVKQDIKTKPETSATPKMQTKDELEVAGVANKKEQSQTAENTAIDEQSAYTAAYELVQQKKYPEAEKAFREFQFKYPKSDYLPNVYYWLGEVYLEQKQNSSAINSFKTVITEYPQSAKVALAMLKLGFAYQAAGRVADAQIEFKKVQQQFPDTSAARLAAAKLKEMSAGHEN